MTSAEEALERAIADACLAADAGRALRDDLPGFLAARGVAPADIQAVLRAPRRLAVYRSLVRNGLSAVVLRMLPRTRARLNATREGELRFDSDFAAFIDQNGPRTRFVRDVPFEFVAWASPRWRSDPSVPGYIADLASYELTHFEVASAPPRRPGVDVTEVALDRPVVFHESARLVSYSHAVYELSCDDGASDEPRPVDAHLLAYRDAAYRVLWLELPPFAAALAGRLLSGEALGTALARECAATGTPPTSVAPEVARLLADLGARGALLGGRDG